MKSAAKLQLVRVSQNHIRVIPKKAEPAKPTRSPALRRQQELAWLLYITEGFIANVEHAERMNIFHLDRKDCAVLRQMKKEAETSAALLRKRMNVEVFSS
jgi:hypothetical protein